MSKKNEKCLKLSELKGEMRKNDITIGELALELGRSTSGMSKILNGETDITLKTMRKIVKIMNEKTSKDYTLQRLFA